MMTTSLSSRQKVENCFDLKPIKDRSEIPVYPMLVTYPGRFAGLSQKAIMEDPKVWMQALKTTYDYIGYPDLSMSLCLGDVIFAEGLEAMRPGYQLPDDDLFQFIEKPKMDHDDYREIIKNGWAPFFNRYMMRIQNPPFKTNIGLTLRWIKLGINMGKIAKFLTGIGVEPLQGYAMMPLFDNLSLIRSFEPFLLDLYDEPGLIQELMIKEVPGLISSALKNAGRSSVKRIQVYAMRSDANSISPAMFDEFAFPHLKKMIEAFNTAGYRTILHADGNWIPILDRFLQLPNGSVHFEFDGVTDIFQAAEILEGHHSIRGDVPATMLAFGKAEDVSEYCEKLITDIGMKGGFILGSGCEVPLNCKPENLKAMMDSVK
jgi:uroporphyrinogen decarboxylase